MKTLELVDVGGGRTIHEVLNLGFVLNHRVKPVLDTTVFGSRYDQVLHLANLIYNSNGGKQLSIAEIGVEKGETFRYILQEIPQKLKHYAAVDPYWMEGKES